MTCNAAANISHARVSFGCTAVFVVLNKHSTGNFSLFLGDSWVIMVRVVASIRAEGSVGPGRGIGLRVRTSYQTCHGRGW